jgi:hypothetical protein
MPKTLLKKVKIKKFRALRDVEISFGTDITVICGKNGTAKSSILGIAAQIFSFDKDYTVNESLAFKTITEESFKSQFSDHFRVSPTFDVTGSMEIGIEVFDAYTSTDATGDLTFTTRGTKSGKSPRVVVRNNSTASEGANKDRNFTHPIIFLGLKRLYPIASRENYTEKSFTYFDDAKNRADFINLTNELLGKHVTLSTGTTGTLKSAVSHGTNYDCNSVSAGEDNVGQIVLAILSFRKLKEEYKDKYKGGILLIDEADAGLFPAAQKKLIDVLDRECRNLALQVILTSHSTTLLEKVYEEGLKPHNRSRFRTVYLTDTHGGISVRNDWNWTKIYSDILIQPTSRNGPILPKVNIYFEDKEGTDFFESIMRRHPAKKIINIIRGVSLGCSQYIALVKKGRVPEFKDRSVICLDADARSQIRGLGSVVLLPGNLPPDQLIFEYLYNLPATDEIWVNTFGYTRPVFLDAGSNLRRELSISGDTVDIAAKLGTYSGNQTPRELFKAFYKNLHFQEFVKLPQRSNPWRKWINEHNGDCELFISSFSARVKYILKHVHGVDEGKLSFLNDDS